MFARIACPLILAFALPLCAQPPGGTAVRQATQLDLEGKGTEARRILEEAAASAANPRAKADAQRAIGISWAFEGDCRKTGEYEQLVIDYWIAQEPAEPGSAFYQEGEMADEAGRVCIDAGDPDAAAQWYRKGFELGTREPGISPDRKALWDFRLEHAQARLAARRNNRAEADKHVAAARAALERMTQSRTQQQAFLPYLTGYVAFYLGDYNKALTDLQQAPPNDPFIQCLLGQTYEKLGHRDQALDCYRKAAAATAHNPPAAYAVPFARKKLT